MNFLRKLNREDVIVSPTHDQSKYPLSTSEYESAVRRTKYYITGGTWDFEIPAKCIEVMNLGACLVCPEMPKAAEYGLVNGVTYIKLNSVEEIPAILASDRWEQIAPAGQRLVQERHTVHVRAKQIIRAYQEWKA